MRAKYTCQRCLVSIRSSCITAPPRHNAIRRIATKTSASTRPLNITRAASSSTASAPFTPPNPVPFITSPYQTSASAEDERLLLQPDNLFHSFTHSPSPAIRRRAAFMKQHAYCPHPSHQRTRQTDTNDPHDPENRKPTSTASPPAHVSFECPDCGIPVSCSRAHYEDDYEAHLDICPVLRQINEDDHDLRSGRFFREFQYPGEQRAEEFIVNMQSWDTFLYTRDFAAINDERAMRQATRLLTYPITMATVLHELSPYSIRQGERLTVEGLRSLSALRYTLHPPRSGASSAMSGLRPTPPPVRLFVLGARAESSLPRDVWLQLTHCFPRGAFHIIFIGPESMTGRDDEFPLPERTASNPFGGVVEDRLSAELKITTYVDYFHTMHEAQVFAPFDPYFDAFFLFHPGLGHPASAHEWQDTLPRLLQTKCPVFATGYSEWDMERDRQWVMQQAAGEVDVLLEPGENRFRSLRWDLNDLDPADVSCGNWGLWGFRGKRYEATSRDV